MALQRLCRVGGYVSSRLYTSLGGVDQKKNTFITATLLPTYVCASLLCLPYYLTVCSFVFMVMFLLNLVSSALAHVG